MKKEITIKIVACGLVAVTLMGFASCKKKDRKDEKTTTSTTKSAWLDEEYESTTVITDENGEAKTYVVGKNDDGTTSVYEKVTDVDGKLVKGEDGKAVTKPYVAPGEPAQENPATGVNGTTNAPATQPNTPSTTSPKTTVPKTNPPATKPPVTQPPATNPPATQPPVTQPPGDGKVTLAQRQALEDKMIRTAKEIGYTLAVRDLESEQHGWYSGDSTAITTSSYDEYMGDDRFGLVETVKRRYNFSGKRKMILMWQDTPEYWVLYLHFE